MPRSPKPKHGPVSLHITSKLVVTAMLCTTCLLAFSGWLRAWDATRPGSTPASALAPGPDDAARRLAQVERMYGMREPGPWLSYVKTLGSERVPPFTLEAQRWIWERQNPEPSSCASRKFLLGFSIPRQGMGSSLHVAAALLGNALQFDHIFMWHPSEEHVGEEYVDPGCGRNKSYTNFDCLFERPTACSDSHVTENNSVSKVAFTEDWEGELPWTRRRPPVFWEERLTAHYAALGVAVSEAYLKMWWRAQAVAYLVRPNAATLAAVRQLRLDQHMHRVAWNGTLQRGEKVPFPLPPGTISMHVRHGDKVKEMKLIGFTAYVDAAEQLAIQNPLSYKRLAFVSSEDPRVIKDAVRLTIRDNGTAPDRNWVIYSSVIQRMNSGPIHQLEKSARKGLGRSALTHTWILQLLMALECDAWVGTRNSNWNRLIDELRCTMLDKCHAPYLEVGRKKDWLEYHWR